MFLIYKNIKNMLKELKGDERYLVNEQSEVLDTLKNKILTQLLAKDKKGNPTYKVCKINGKNKRVHILVGKTFLGDAPKNLNNPIIDHISNDRNDNSLSNLQLISQRNNSLKEKLKKVKSSKFIGVYLNKERGKYQAQIQINGKMKYLGRYDNEHEAAEAYKNELIKINEVTP